MPEVKKIMYASDLSGNSAYAFQYASDYADKYGADLIILHVLEEAPLNVRSEMDHYVPEDKLKKPKLVEEIKSRLEEFCGNVRSDDPSCEYRVVRVEICEGRPEIEILKKADEFECDVIIMGTHGKGVISHALLGSVAEKVLRQSRKPVFIIPLPKGDGLGIRDI